jgi:hypothetical protein
VPAAVVVRVLAAALAGAAVGLLGSFYSRAYVPVAGLDVPVGLPAALVTTALAVALAGALSGARRVAAAASLGWLGSVLVLAGGRPEGDVVVAGDTTGLVWLGVGVVAAIAPAAMPYGRLRPPEPVGEAPAPMVGPTSAAPGGQRAGGLQRGA